MRPNSLSVRTLVVVMLVVAQNGAPLLADVVGVRVWQMAEVSVTAFPPGQAPLPFTRVSENFDFPPRNVEASASGAPYSSGSDPSRAKSVISEYSGPMSVGDVSTALVLRGSLTSFMAEPHIVHTDTAQALISYVFKLNETHSYSLSTTGAANLILAGSGPVGVGTGTLDPGTYTLFAGVPYFNPTNPNYFETTYDLVVSTPEPTSAMSVTIAGLFALRRRRA